MNYHINRHKYKQDYFYKVPVNLYDTLQRQFHKPYSLLSQPHDCRRLLTPPSLNAGNTIIYEHMISCNHPTLPTCEISLGSLTLPAPETGDFLELILL